MTDTFNNVPPQGEPIRRLKKIKRPIKRRIIQPLENDPQGMTKQTPDSLHDNYSASDNSKDFNLDEILDGPASLPATQSTNFPFQSEDYDRPQFIDESAINPPKLSFKDQLVQDNMFTPKGVMLIALSVFCIGIFFAKMFFAEQTVVRDGLQGVVINSEVPRGRARCGVAERTQGCVLYLMNPQRQELSGRDFYDLASQLTSRQRFVIETGNMRYANVKIRPGSIAQINIPPLQ